MARHHPSASAAHQPSAQAGRHDVPVIFDAFVSDIYLPHVKLRTGNGCRETERRVP